METEVERSDQQAWAPRQQVLVLYLATSSLRSRVVSWSKYDGASHEEPDTGEETEPPYETGLDALRDGWRLFAASPLLPPDPGTEYLTSHHKFEFLFERIVGSAPYAQGAGLDVTGAAGLGPAGYGRTGSRAAHPGAAGPSGGQPPHASAPGELMAGDGPKGHEDLLSTEQMAEFVARGVLVFAGLVPAEVNAVAASELADERGGLRHRYEHGSALAECFGEYPGISAFIGLPAVQGIIRSLIGLAPIYDHHAVHSRVPGQPSQQLHADAIIDLRAAYDIQLMYYPQAVGPDAGGTLLIPGSHLRRINETDIGRYQNIAGQVGLSCPAGTAVVLHHGLWHCGRRNRTDRVRHMFKLRLGARAPQVRLWDTSDLGDEAVQQRVKWILGTSEPWYEQATARIEQVQRAALWRRLTGDPDFQVEYWLGRLENQPEPRLADLLP